MSKGGLDRKRLTNELSPDELKAYLNDIMDAEVKKPLKEMDPDIIDECAKWLLELNGQDVEITDETIKQRAKSIIAEHYRPRNRRFNYKHIRSSAIAVACIVILMSIQVIAVKAFGVNFFELTKDKFLDLLGMEFQQDTVDLTASNSREYKTLEEIEAAANIVIIAPKWLPENVEMESIDYYLDYEDQKIILLYDDNITSLTIKINSNIPNADDSEIYITSDTVFYVFKEAKVIWWEYNGSFYNLICGFDINEYAEKIIENIK